MLGFEIKREQPTDESELLTVDYWLPLTKVNVTGTVVTAEGSPAGVKTDPQATPAAVSVVTRPDYEHPRRLEVAAQTWLERQAEIDLQPDGRLSSVKTSTTSYRGDMIKSILGFTVTGAEIGAAIGGPIGAGIGGGVALAAVASTALAEHEDAKAQDIAKESGTHERRTRKARTAHDKLDIDPNYAKDEVAEADQLRDLRLAEAHARLAFAAAAGSASNLDTMSTQLKAAADCLRLIRAELAVSEAAYQKWLNKQVTTTSVSYDEEITISALPATSGGAKEWYAKSPSDSSADSFHEACTSLGIVLTCEIADPPAFKPDAGTSAPVRKKKEDKTKDLHYRVLRPAILRVFAATIDDTQQVELEERSTQRILVALPGHEHDIPMFEASGKQTFSVAFDGTGALTSISNDVTSEVASAAQSFGDLPAALKDAVDAGGELAKPFTAAGRAQALQDQESLSAAQAALHPAADPLQNLKNQVAQAELQARLKVAGQLASGEASNAVIVLGSTAAPPAG
jgi:hypothetical protein